MEQILAFVLGAGAVVLIWGVVVAFMTAKKVRNLEGSLSATQTELAIAKNEIYETIGREVEAINRSVDSRIDKAEKRIINNLYVVKRDLEKETLKG